MIAQELLKILCCPETKEDLFTADGSLIQLINSKIESGMIKNRVGLTVSEKIDGGLIRKDKKYLYPIRDDIPIMLMDDSLPMEQFEGGMK